MQNKLLKFFLAFNFILLSPSVLPSASNNVELMKQNWPLTVFLGGLINPLYKEAFKFIEKFVLLAMALGKFLTEI